MSARPCAMAALVEAQRDGRLGELEASSIERHLAGCAECAAFAEDLARLARLVQAPLPPVSELDRRRARVRLLQCAAASPPSPSRRRLAILVAVPLLAICGVAAAKFTPWSSGADRPSQHAPLLVAGWTARVAGALALEAVAFEDVSTPAAGASVSISAETAPHGVDSMDGRGASAELAAIATPSPFDAPSIAPPSPSASAVPRRPSRAAHATVPADARDTSPVPIASRASAFDEAVGLVDRGDYGAATERLEAFQRTHAKDPRAEDAAFLAIVALEHAGRRAEAVRAARTYLAAYPNGFRRAEAEAIAAAP